MLGAGGGHKARKKAGGWGGKMISGGVERFFSLSKQGQEHKVDNNCYIILKHKHCIASDQGKEGPYIHIAHNCE